MSLLGLQKFPRLKTVKDADILLWAKLTADFIDDRSGQLIFPYNKVKLITGTNQDVKIPDATFIQVAPDGLTGNFIIGGIAGGTLGRFIILLNMTPFTMTIHHLDAGSQSANQVDNTAPGGVSINTRLVALIHGTDTWYAVSYI